jgi:predicted enzyme related to lactoylglutathione lyase
LTKRASRACRAGASLARYEVPLAGDPVGVIVFAMGGRLSLLEFPADDPDRARRFWSGLLEARLERRAEGEGEGWQTREQSPMIGVHSRGRGPGDSFSLPYFGVRDLAAALERVTALGGSVVHSGARWAVCKDSEGSPFGLALEEPAPGMADS